MRVVGLILYWLVRNGTSLLSRLYFRASYEGLENVPATGAFVLAPVHRSNLDFALMSVVTKRRMRYMGKESLWKYPWFGRLIEAMGAYPVSRGKADREALRRTVEVLGEGDGLVLFPEGTRRSGPVIEELYEGAAFVASRADVPIIPVGIGGTERSMPKGARIPRPVKVRVVVGPPLYPPPLPEGRRHPPRKSIHELTHALQKELQRLLEEAEGGRTAQLPESRVNETRSPDVS
ncbi:MAG: 1-acyl-sn-glycerol-3-phosphate acyltransferase [Actinomycetota bacterium]|jgi:1-acyl-sn-glycerol-3-phosphate acyltransferase|nr:1-acyl-sn-glycerol-3-phosphate acyltransferase [Actinomycetota bacterium]